MKVWSTEEIADLALLLGLDVERLTTFASSWGGVPRTLLRLRDLSEASFEREILRAASRAVRTCQSFIPVLEDLDVEKSTPSLIFFIRPEEDSNGVVDRCTPVVYVPTSRIVDALAVALRRQSMAVKIAFFGVMETNPTTHQSGGCIYKNWFHSLFSSGEIVDCQWHVGPDSGLPDALQTTTRLVSSTDDEIKDVEAPFYWMAPKSNYPGIDGALVTEQEIFVIQITMSHRRMSLQKGLDELRNKVLREKKNLCWRVLFVGLQEEQARRVSMKHVGSLTVGSPNSKASVPIGWCAVDPTERNITYVGSGGMRYDPPVECGESAEADIGSPMNIEHEISELATGH